MVRRDLPFGPMVAQVAHAAGSGSDRHPEGTYVVVLGVDSEGALLDVCARLSAAGVRHTQVVESEGDLAGQCTAIGLELVRDRAPARRVLSSLPLLRGCPMH